MQAPNLYLPLGEGYIAQAYFFDLTCEHGLISPGSHEAFELAVSCCGDTNPGNFIDIKGCPGRAGIKDTIPQM